MQFGELSIDFNIKKIYVVEMLRFLAITEWKLDTNVIKFVIFHEDCNTKFATISLIVSYEVAEVRKPLGAVQPSFCQLGIPYLHLAG